MSRSLALSFAILSLAACVTATEEPDVDVGSSDAELAGTGPAGTMFIRPVQRTSSWIYNAEGIDYGLLGPAWRTGQDLGPTWKRGDGTFGYGESYIATTTTASPERGGFNPTTVYFVRSFNPGDVTIRKLYLRVRYDDGFVFYLNGHEGGRASMPSGPVRYGTLATTTREAGDGYTTFDISGQIPNVHALAPNHLAIEVHQSSTSSSDLVFDAELIAWVDRPATLPTSVGIPRSGLWAFSDGGADLGDAWRAASYDDSASSVGRGPMGHGETYIVADTAPGSITTYFRTHFQNDGSLTTLAAEVRYDDGFVAYLNGHEIARRSMPTGAVTAATLSTGHEATSYDVLNWDAAVPFLVAGDNVLAVEVHQSAATSSDLVFDLALHKRTGWHPQASGTGDALSAIACSAHQHCWAVGDDGTVVRTTDSGGTWRAQDVGVRVDFRDIDFVDGGFAYMVGTGGTVLFTENTGNQWTKRNVPVSEDLVDLQLFNSDARVAFALSNQHLWATYDEGLDWTQMPALPPGTWWGMGWYDTARGWLVGQVPVDGDTQAAIYRTTDGGATWVRQWLSGVHFAYLWDVDVTRPTDAWAFGQDSLSGHGERKMTTRDGGITWTRAPDTSNESAILDMKWNGPEIGWGVGYGGTIIKTIDEGQSWRVQQVGQGTGGNTLRGVEIGNVVMAWAVGEHGTIVATTNGGN